MCLLFVYINPSPKSGQYKVILINNRDETFSRPTKPAFMFNESPVIIAGVDNFAGREGGTWLAANSNGKIGCLLNVLHSVEDTKLLQNAQSRGFLVIDYLKGNESSTDYANQIYESNVKYNDFNLVLLEPLKDSYNLVFYNNNSKPEKLGSGCYGFGNCPRHLPFRKVGKGLTKFKELIEDSSFDYLNETNQSQLEEKLFSIMKDNEANFPDHQMAAQGAGFSEHYIKSLSSISVKMKDINYGTRTTSMVLVTSSDEVVYKEVTMKEPIDLNDVIWIRNEFSLKVE